MYFFVVIKITETENLSDCNEHGDNKTRQTNAKTNISHVGGMRSPFGTYSIAKSGHTLRFWIWKKNRAKNLISSIAAGRHMPAAPLFLLSYFPSHHAKWLLRTKNQAV